MKLVSKVTEIYCIADDFCKEYELELNKKALSLSNPSPNSPKTRNRKGRMSDAEMIHSRVVPRQYVSEFQTFLSLLRLPGAEQRVPQPAFVYPLCGTYAPSGNPPFALP